MSRFAVRSSLRAKQGSAAKSGHPEHDAQLLELGVVGSGDDQVAVGGRERFIGEDARVGVAHPVRDDAPGHERAGVVGEAG